MGRWRDACKESREDALSIRFKITRECWHQKGTWWEVCGPWRTPEGLEK